MRVLPVDRLEPGMVLAVDVATRPNGPPLLRTGVALDERYRRALVTAGVTTVWVEDGLGEGVAPLPAVDEATRLQATTAVASALADVRSAAATGKPLADRAVEELTRAAGAIVEQVLALPTAALHLADMVAADGYLLQHAVDVCTLGVLLADRATRAAGWRDASGRVHRDGHEARMTQLGLGLLLHDIGKLVVPSSVLDKPGPLDEDEWALVRRHPELGAEMLGPDASYLVRAVVRHHHERWDGRGYPDGLSGEAIHRFARFAAVADVYDAVTSERVYKRAAPPDVGYALVAGDSGRAFDPEVVAAFTHVVVPYPVGHEVLLADGRTGLVSAVDLAAPLRPTVRVALGGGRFEEVAGAEPASAAALAGEPAGAAA